MLPGVLLLVPVSNSESDILTSTDNVVHRLVLLLLEACRRITRVTAINSKVG